MFFASHPLWLGRVRDPLPGEARASAWRPPDPLPFMLAERRDVTAAVESAFDGVSREGGVSLREARVIDCYGSPEEREQARRLDDEPRWQEVPHGDLETFDSALSFFDAVGFRYYLPAYMTWDLWKMTWLGASPRSHLWFHLRHEGRARILDAAQSRAVYRYLRFVADYAGPFAEKYAGEAIESFWRRFGEAPAR